MSRLAKKKIKIPGDTSYKIENNLVEVKGPLGSVFVPYCKGVNLKVENQECSFEGDVSSAMLGTFAMNFKNAVEGVNKYFEEKITLIGVGYKVEKKTDSLEFKVGFSHVVQIPLESNVVYEVTAPTELILKSCSKRLVADVADAIVKSTRKPEPYKGKGVLREGTFVRRKEGKKK